MNILIGWWAIPTILTLIFFYIGSRYAPTSSADGLDIATIATLVVWLVYAFAT